MSSLREIQHLQYASHCKKGHHDAFDREDTYGSGGIRHDWRIKIAAHLKKLETYSNPVVVAVGK
jgi:hypothetical protein